MREPIPFGRYWLLDRVAVGGMAEVFVAVRREDASGRPLAVKRILPTLAEDAELVTMFLDEARLVAQLDHPGIVPIHELGKVGESYFIAMEYVAGRDLRALAARLKARGERLPFPLVAYLGCRIADALDHAHRKKGADGEPLSVVHRDVSPANVLVGFDGSVRVIDFGIAEASIVKRRQAGVLRGKFAYMSPEMVRGGPVDRRSDVFALGIVLHELLTGERLFAAPSELAVMEKVRKAEVPSPAERNPEVPEALSAVILRALSRDPSSRYDSASDLRDALLKFTLASTQMGDPPALARLVSSRFPSELREELDRMERLESLPRTVDTNTRDEPTRIVPWLHVTASRRRSSAKHRDVRLAAKRRLRRAILAAASIFVLLATGTVAVLIRSAPAALASEGRARLVVQANSKATLLVDGVPSTPPLEAGQSRTITVAPGPHRIEMRAQDGRSVGATVLAREGQSAELIAVELE